MDETGVPHSTTIVNTIRIYVIKALQASSVPEVHIASVSDALETILPALHPQVSAQRAIQSALTGALASSLVPEAVQTTVAQAVEQVLPSALEPATVAPRQLQAAVADA